MATSAVEAGNSSEMKASDSQNANAATKSGAHAACWPTKVSIASIY